MDKVQKRGFIKYNTPSSEPFRIEYFNSDEQEQKYDISQNVDEV
jgi:hypothetical protein